MFLQAPPTPWQAQMCPLVTPLEVAEQAVSGIGQPLASSLQVSPGQTPPQCQNHGFIPTTICSLKCFQSVIFKIVKALISL